MQLGRLYSVISDGPSIRSEADLMPINHTSQACVPVNFDCPHPANYALAIKNRLVKVLLVSSLTNISKCCLAVAVSLFKGPTDYFEVSAIKYQEGGYWDLAFM